MRNIPRPGDGHHDLLTFSPPPECPTKKAAGWRTLMFQLPRSQWYTLQCPESFGKTSKAPILPWSQGQNRAYAYEARCLFTVWRCRSRLPSFRAESRVSRAFCLRRPPASAYARAHICPSAKGTTRSTPVRRGVLFRAADARADLFFRGAETLIVWKLPSGRGSASSPPCRQFCERDPR